MVRRRRRQRGGTFRGRNRQRGRGFFSNIKKHVKKYGKIGAKLAFHHGKRLALAKAREYAPQLANKALQRLQQYGNGRRMIRRRQRGRGAVGDFLGSLAKTVVDKASKAIPI